MNATLLAVNAKYVHSSLAVWFVAGGAEKYAQMPHTVRVAEATINQNPADILARVCAGSPELVGISSYIWNAALLPELIAGLRKRLPVSVRVLPFRRGKGAPFSVDRMIFNLGINATSIYPKEDWAEKYILRESLWDAYLAQHGNADERMHISELPASLRGQAS